MARYSNPVLKRLTWAWMKRTMRFFVVRAWFRTKRAGHPWPFPDPPAWWILNRLEWQVRHYAEAVNEASAKARACALAFDKFAQICIELEKPGAKK